MRLFALIGCLCLSLSGLSAAAETPWKLVFQDDFDRAELGADWDVEPGMSIINGRMRLVGTIDAKINRHFKPDIRLEFDGWAVEGIPPCDMSVTLCGGEVGMGYLLGFGAQNNHANHLIGPGVHFVDHSPPFVIEQGKKYHCVAQKEGKHISYVVNGTTLFDVTTDDPLGGPGFDVAGILAWTGLDIDNVRVYERETAHPDAPRTLESIPDGPLYREGRKLVIRAGAASTPALQSAVAAFNDGRIDDALKQFRSMGGTLAGLLGQAYALGDLGYVEKYKHPEFEALAKDFEAAGAARPDDTVLANYALLAKWFATLKMARSGEAAVATIRFRHLGEKNNPFFYKARMYEARYKYWNGAEGGDHKAMDEARDWMAALKTMWPDNIILREYTGDDVPWGEQYNADTTRHPAWAAYLREAYVRQVEFMHHFINERQDAEGAFGGGYGDDCEMMRTWMQIAAISTAAERARMGIQNLAEGIWKHELTYDGYAGMSDVEHSSEPGADMLPGMLFIRYGDPLWVERNLLACKTIKTTYMGIDANGYPRFQSSTFGGGEVERTTLGGGDSGYCGRPMKHFIWEAWRGNPDARDWFARWADGWRALTMKEIDGKMVGVIPYNVWYPSGSICAPVKGATWWDPKLNYIVRSDMIVDVFLAAYSLTEDPKFLRPYQLGMQYGSLGPIRRPPAPEGSREWQIASMIGYSGNMSTEQCKAAVYKWLTGDPAYDDFILAYGDRTQIYRVNGDLDAYMKSFQAAASGLRYNLDLQTTEVLSTDRCGLPHALAVFGAYTGAQTGMRDAATPSFSITYDTPTMNFAALVTEATRERLRVWLYNFEDEPMPIGLKLWRLKPGSYIVSQGEQVPGERECIHRYRWEDPQTVKILRRAEGPTITVPPGKVWCVDLRLDEPIDVPALAPDLAVAPRDVARTDRGLTITVHNVGNADVTAFDVAVQTKNDARWTTVATKRCAGLNWPKDLTASATTVEVPLDQPAAQGEWRILLTPGDGQFDLNESNNLCVVK